MTFLELCQAVAQESGVARDASVALSTTAGQTGELRRIVDWTARAWLDIQGGRLWEFLWERPTLTLLANASTIAATIAPPRYVIEEGRTFLLTPSQSNDRALCFLPWDEFAMDYQRLNSDDSITAWSVRPDKTLVFNAKTTVNVSIQLERYKAPQLLAANADVPACDEDLHMAIVHRACIKYAGFDEAGSQRQIALDEFNGLMADMRARHLPTFRIGGPMLED